MLDPQSPVPLYHQLKQVLLEEIRSGRWQAYEAIPPERELIARYRVSRTTVRQALSDLVTAGVLYRVHGKGTFVGAPRLIVETLSTLTGHVEELHLHGLHPAVTVLCIAGAQPPPVAAAALGLSRTATALRVHRLIHVAESPLLTVDAWFPTDLGLRITAEELHSTPIYRVLEANGVWPVRGEQRIRAATASPREAELLRLDSGQAVLEVVRTVFSTQDQPIEWTRAIYHPDRYEYVVELRRRGGRT